MIDYIEKVFEFTRHHLLAYQHSIDLRLAQNNLKNIKKKDILLFSVMKNETFRLPYFLKYYRDLGVNHFIFVDNDSDDGMMELLKDHQDISVFFTDKSYKESHFGVHWLNYLLKKYGTSHWSLTVDPDEFLVYPHIDDKNLKQLTAYLDNNKRKSLFAPLVDMYSSTQIDKTYYAPGDNPFNICPYFDKNCFMITDYHKDFRCNILKGGVRQRVFNADNPHQSPLLNKTPLIKWKKHYAYLFSTHFAIPRFLNKNNDTNLIAGALMHFKFLDKILDKIAIEMDAQQHWDDSYEYKQYAKTFKEKKLLYDHKISARYEDWHTLDNYKCLHKANW